MKYLFKLGYISSKNLLYHIYLARYLYLSHKIENKIGRKRRYVIDYNQNYCKAFVYNHNYLFNLPINHEFFRCG
jgi:hypothetical protein